ncbi:hypothetical protein EEL30_12120 [Brevibacillus laterosporus]|uniref:DUF7660 domain-containing protein n=1 Tax=Brevibacillus laterosporus TaxID=1465 RepID=A0A518V7Q5_BRELA|nr:hypothetical protein EEL30_12120 [Brevibacillus laterosporus]
MRLSQRVKIIKTKEDFVEFLGLLVNDFENNRDEWENESVDSYLAGMQSWIEDSEGYYENSNIPLPDNIDWNFFANVLYAAKIYE